MTGHERPFQGAILTPVRWCVIMGSLSVVALILAVVCLQLGTQYIGLGKLISVLSSALFDQPTANDGLKTTSVILLQVRLPRVFLGFLVGVCLASVGVALQALLRNPLADPYVLGVSSG
ncbi:MAG: iron chelate uptake ABC transporter family permease subunit, partial [Nitrospira sp.]